MKNQAQLITYVDRLSGGTFRDLKHLLDGPFSGVFGGVHVLPFFHPIDGADAGFDPIDHTQVDSRLSATPRVDLPSSSYPPHDAGGGACESLTFATIQVDRRAAIWHDLYAI
jgi:sucrose phosphorylase